MISFFFFFFFLKKKKKFFGVSRVLHAFARPANQQIRQNRNLNNHGTSGMVDKLIIDY